MRIPLQYKRTYGKWFATSVLKAVSRYRLLEDGDRILVGLSGGGDSIALLVILDYLRRHSPVRFDLLGAHVRLGDEDTAYLKAVCGALDVEYREVTPELRVTAPRKGVCYLCARIKRGALRKVALGEACNKIAFGHHADDVAETVLINLSRAGRFSSFSPRTNAGGPSPCLIRPLVYLRKSTLIEIQRHAGLCPPNPPCPFGKGDERRKARGALGILEKALEVPELPLKIVGALEDTGVWRP